MNRSLLLLINTSALVGSSLQLVALPNASAQEKEKKAEEIRQFDTGEQGAIQIAVSPNGRFALSGGTDGTVRYWELATGKELKKAQGTYR